MQLDAYASKANEHDVERIEGKLPSMKRGRIKAVWQDVMDLWRMVRDKDAPWASRALAIGALVYLISPIDLIPDLIPILGLSDDVGVILSAVAALAADLKIYRTRT